MSFNPKTIAKEWSHRISTGMPNPKSKWHIEKLEELLNEKGYSKYFIDELVENLLGVEKELEQSILPEKRKEFYLDDKFYEWLEQELSKEENDFLSEARVYQSKYSTGDIFQFTSDKALSIWKGVSIQQWDETDSTFVDIGKAFNAEQVFTKQGDTDPKSKGVNYIKLGSGTKTVTMKGSDGNIYVLESAESNLKLFSKAKSPSGFNWSAEALETAGGCGIYMDGAKHADKLQQYMQSKNAAAVGKQVMLLKSDVKSALGKANFASKGVNEFNSKFDTADADNWYLFALLAAGMNDFKHSNLGETVVHDKINDYYKALQENELVDTSCAKANTADMVITNASTDDALIKLIKGKSTDGKYRYIGYNSEGVCEIYEGVTKDSKSTGIKFVQMSMKKAAGKAQLGKITSLVRNYFDMKDNKGYMIDFVGEKQDEGWLSKGFEKVKSIGKSIVSKITKFVVKIQNIGTKFFNKWKGKKGKPKDIKDFFGKNKFFKSAVTKALKEGVIDSHYVSSTGLLLEKKGVGDLNLDDKLKVLESNQKALNQSITMTQAKVNTLLKASSPISIAVKLDGTLSKGKKMKKGDIYKLMSNYVSADFLNSMIKDGKKQVKPVKEILKDFAMIEKEMIYGRSSLPIWKVYGRGTKNSTASHTKYEGSKEFVEAKVGELLGNTESKIIFATLGTLQSKNFYTFTVWLVAGVDESSNQLIYTKNRIGTNSGDENFSWIFEGTARNNEEQVRAKVV